MKYLSIAALSSLLSVCSIEGAVTLDFQADQLRRADGTTPIGNSSLVIIVADTSRNGFSSLLSGGQLSVNGLLAGTDDRVVGRFDLSLWGDGAAQTPFGTTFDFANYTGWDTGDPLAFYWFPDLTLSDLSLDTGDSYGRYLGPGSDGGNWITPTDGQEGKFLFLTTAGGTLGPGTLASGLGTASSTVTAVPEPGKSVLLLIGMGMLLFARKRSDPQS